MAKRKPSTGVPQMTILSLPSDDSPEIPASRLARSPITRRALGEPHSSPEDDSFRDDYEFVDDVHRYIYLNRAERDIVDTPEFRRLFRLGQLGFVDLVFPTANHTRAVHSIGTCFLGKKLVDTLNSNNARCARAPWAPRLGVPQISFSERVLIGLGALLHDVSHGPYSHDIEKKTHQIYPKGKSVPPLKLKSHYGPYEKHDNFAFNPALYVFLMDQHRSLLARVLRRYSPAFSKLLLADADRHPHLAPFVEELQRTWPLFQDEILPNLILHLLVFEKPEDAESPSLVLRTSFFGNVSAEWGLGPRDHWEQLHQAWYQPFRHDIIGDTLSADLIDYLLRDQSRLGMKADLDLKLLDYYILVSSFNLPSSGPVRYRCAIDLNDHKRGTFRAERLNDLFRLLDIRHQIHEKAVHHRVVQAAIAMLSRAGLVLGELKPSLSQLYGVDEAVTPALAGDDRFLESLIAAARTLGGSASEDHRWLAFKLAERRVYRPLMVIPGDRVGILLEGLCDSGLSLEHQLRELAAIVDTSFFSRFFLLISLLIEKLLQHAIVAEEVFDRLVSDLASDGRRLERVSAVIPRRVIFWTNPYKQLYKDPAILVRVNDEITDTIDALQDVEGISAALRLRVQAGIRDAETKNEGLWKLYVFLSDGLFYTGTLAKLIKGHPCCSNPSKHEEHLQVAQGIIVRALRSAWRYWQASKKAINLADVSSLEELARILRVFLNEGELFRLGDNTSTREVSAVNVSQYVHGEDMRKCRDVRYKFDLERPLEESLEAVPEGGQRDAVRQALRALSIATRDMNGEEVGELTGRLAAASSELPALVDTTRAARGRPFEEEKLREIWCLELR